MQYKFKNEVVLEVPEKFIITTSNLLIYYLIIKVGHTKLYLITIFIFISIEFGISGKVNCTYDGSAKAKRKTRFS